MAKPCTSLSKRGRSSSPVQSEFALSAPESSCPEIPRCAPCVIDRFAMEVKRQRDVLGHRLAEATYVAGNGYTIADITSFSRMASS
jgi:glutathione S-transferase